jgi:3-deoxy-manno-octulosonate cytidylyltransferase (CMP-KDO synthetase)
MIEHVYRRAADARGIDAVVVATDDERIAATVESFGGIARMTQAAHRTGTDRIAEVANDLSCEILINVQGDLPLIEPDMISEVLHPLITDPSVKMSTLRQAMTDAADIASPHVVKVVVDNHSDALYFSRTAIPFRRDRVRPKPNTFTSTSVSTDFDATSCLRSRLSLKRRSNKPSHSNSCAHLNMAIGFAPL